MKKLLSILLLCFCLSANAQQDTIPPQLTNFEVTLNNVAVTEVDLTSGSEVVYFNIESEDDNSGVTQVIYRLYYNGEPVTSTQGWCGDVVCFNSYSRDINQFNFEMGTYQIEIELHDYNGNVNTITSDDLEILGFQSELTIFTSELAIDTIPPQLTNFEVTLNNVAVTEVDLTSGSEVVYFNIESEDDNSGVTQVIYRLYYNGEPVNSTQGWCGDVVCFNSYSRDINQFNFEMGTYQIEIELHDYNGNVNTITSDDLEILGFQSELTIFVSGCMDESASNYNPEANTDNDASCVSWEELVNELQDQLDNIFPDDGISQEDVDAAYADALMYFDSLSCVAYTDYYIDLPEGWSLIGYTCNEVVDVIDALSSIASDVVIVKDEEGLSYLPEWGFNAIGEFTYGEGYQIKLYNQVDNFQFCQQIIGQ